MYERENLPPQVFFGSLAIICAIFVLLVAPYAFAKPSHHPRALAEAGTQDATSPAEAPTCVRAISGPVHHHRVESRSCDRRKAQALSAQAGKA